MTEKIKVYVDNYSWFDVTFDDKGEPSMVTETRIVWNVGKDHGGNRMMTERINKAIHTAKTTLTTRNRAND